MPFLRIPSQMVHMFINFRAQVFIMNFVSVQCNKTDLHAGGTGVGLYDGPDLKLFSLVGFGRSFLSVACPTVVQLVFLLKFYNVVWRPGISIAGQPIVSVTYCICESSFLTHIGGYHNSFVFP